MVSDFAFPFELRFFFAFVGDNRALLHHVNLFGTRVTSASGGGIQVSCLDQKMGDQYPSLTIGGDYSW
ncbi:MAG: hypothetical protein CMJ80_04595 [Planctomycetaceae bacterium]|nr:hypothetical protein [Planctomycetaceae bacterium]